MKRLLLFAFIFGLSCNESGKELNPLAYSVLNISSSTESVVSPTDPDSSNVLYPSEPIETINPIQAYDCYTFDGVNIYGYVGQDKFYVPVDGIAGFVLQDFYRAQSGELVIIGNDTIFVQYNGSVRIEQTELARKNNPVLDYLSYKWKIKQTLYTDFYVTDLFNLTIDSPADRYYQINHFCESSTGAYYSTQDGNGGITRPAGIYYWPDTKSSPILIGNFTSIF